MAWGVLLLAGLLEIVWSAALKKADGLRRPWWGVAGLALAVTSLVLLSIALRDLPVGTAYAVWVGVGAVGVTLTGMAVFGDRHTPLRLASLAAIIIGITGLRLLD